MQLCGSENHSASKPHMHHCPMSKKIPTSCRCAAFDIKSYEPEDLCRAETCSLILYYTLL